MENQVVELLNQSVNLSIVIICLCVGYIIKHLVKSVANDYIPVILILSGIVLSLLLAIPDGYYSSDIILKNVICGIASGWTSIGIHQTGKVLTKHD